MKSILSKEDLRCLLLFRHPKKDPYVKGNRQMKEGYRMPCLEEDPVRKHTNTDKNCNACLQT
jgi:hypothetical protein